MKRFWMTAFLMTGLFAVLATPVAAKSSDNSSADTDTSMDDVNSALGSMAVKLNDLEKSLGLKFFGDMRLRYAFATQSPSLSGGATIADKSQGRYRARFGAAMTSGDFTGQVRFATGATNSPWSQNNTFDNAFTDPTVNIDTADIIWKPKFAEGMLSITAGKMGNPLTKTVISWDPDIQPEGAYLEFKKSDFTIRATYFELQNLAPGIIPNTTLDLFMDNLQLEYVAKFDGDTSLGVMGGYEYIPNSTYMMSSGVSTALAKNPITGFTGVLDPGGVARDWNNVEAMLYLKNKIGNVPFKWYVHGTDNLNGKNLPVGAGYSKTFTNQYALLFGVDVGQNSELGEFAGTLFYAQTDPNCTLPFLVDDDSGRTNTSYVFGSLSTLLDKGVTLKLSQWVAGHEYNNLIGTNSRNPTFTTYVDCIVNL